jgi:hypothetical protein
MTLRVDCLPGPTGALDPSTVWFGERPLAVRAVVDRWDGTGQRWWKVDTDEGQYVVRRDEATGDWELAAVVGG